jgi:UDP-N-acetylmuramate dehydrogenase
MRDWGEYLRTWLPEGAVQEHLPLRDKTNLRIGGPARYCVTIRDREQMVRLVRECAGEGIRWFLLGGGSNVLFSDHGYEGLVIVNQIEYMENLPGDRLESGAGGSLMDLVRRAQGSRLVGFEQLAGIPGSVGGAVVGNAGAFGRTIGDHLEAVEILTEQGDLDWVSPDTLDIDYRETRLKYCGDVVLSARFRLAPVVQEDLARTIEEILALRSEKHPPHNVATAGSFFKNLPPEEPGGRRIAAGLILDQAGARGLCVGDAAVFEKHANIVINRGKATAAEVLELTGKMKRMAFDHAGIVLEEEVRRIGFTTDELTRYDVPRTVTVR